MTKVITYGTFDLLHRGHIRLLERARQLGDYLIVGITSDDYDKARGKINVQQTLVERISAVRATGLADKIIVEEYEGQKIDDIRRYDIDIFTVGSDWEGVFDYLNEYCKVIYLQRTEGISSSELRQKRDCIRLGLVGYSPFLRKVYNESKQVNTVRVTGLQVPRKGILEDLGDEMTAYTDDYNEMLDMVDAVYIHSRPSQHYNECKQALLRGKHVLCESPLALTLGEYAELEILSKENKCIFMEAIRTAYATAYTRLLLLLKSGKIGDLVSVDATCTSLAFEGSGSDIEKWGALEAWGPTTLLPVFHLLGTNYKASNFFSLGFPKDYFTKIDFTFEEATASIKTGTGVKSEGDLIVSGTKGYAYVPAPWWKTDYFEIRYENPADNKRYFYPNDGEGIRYELLDFSNAIRGGKQSYCISSLITRGIIHVMEQFQANQKL